ncbi:MAG: nucleotidyltransferase substrate binding protein [Methanophagales archaeon]|nr:nucleotidyltransferase substrate binding protein [Methanophagales archaeon]MCW3135117.1 nucleotidyltransferase substrate binding protein [Methanophagales archaeon]
MEKLARRVKEAEKALETLREILREPYSVIVRDATIQRFEYTFEIFWKLVKEYLYNHEGIECNSPKSCFREASSVGLLSEEQTITCLEMTDDRNLTSHTYIEEVAESIYEKIRDYSELMDTVLNHIKKRFEEKV